jgi:hypothetical protein
MDESPQHNLPPHPESSTGRGNVAKSVDIQEDYGFSPQAANGMIGGGFGSLF